MRTTPHGSPAVVVPAVTAQSSVTVIRSLGRRGIHTIAVSENAASPAFDSRYCDEAYLVPDPATDLVGYKDALLALARRPEVATVVPVREQDIYVLAKYRDEFAPHVATPWPTLDQLRTVHDRIRLFEAADAAGVAYPETQLLDQVSDWTPRRIVKGRYALLVNDYLPSVPEHESRSPPKTLFLEPGETPDVDAIVEQMGHTPVAQEFVGGAEYTFRGVFDHGEPVATTTKRLLRGMKYSRGPSVYHEAVDEPELERAALALMRELEWHGLASSGFMRDPETGTFKLIEVNPRVWANIPMDLHAGVDSAYCYWCLATDSLDAFSATYQPGVASHLLRGEASYLYSVLREDYPLVEKPSFGSAVWNVARSLVEQPHFEYLSVDDPMPFVRDLRNALGVVTGRSREQRSEEEIPVTAATGVDETLLTPPR